MNNNSEKRQVIVDIFSICICAVIFVIMTCTDLGDRSTSNDGGKILLASELVQIVLLLGLPLFFLYFILSLILHKRGGKMNAIRFILSNLAVLLGPLYAFIFLLLIPKGSELSLIVLILIVNGGGLINILIDYPQLKALARKI